MRDAPVHVPHVHCIDTQRISLPFEFFADFALNSYGKMPRTS